MKDDKIKEVISHNLKHFRKEKQHLTQERFASQIGVTRAALGAYEEGRTNPPLAVLVVISNLTGIDMHTFVTQKIGEEVGNG